MTREEAINALLTESVEIGGNVASVTRFLTALSMAVSALTEQQNVPDTDVGKMTNADRIRAMSDEELAAVIMCPHQIDGKTDCTEPNCFRCSLKWLQQPAEEDDHA